MERLNSSRVQVEQGIEKAEAEYCANKPKVLTIVWLLVQVFVICVLVSGIAVSGDVAYRFMGIFVGLVCMCVSCFGTIILRKYRTPFHHGILIGVSSMMTVLMLMNTVASGTREPYSPAEGAVLTFSLFLFFLYFVFSILLIKWRDDIIGTLEEDEAEETDGPNASTINGEEGEEQHDLKMV